jgi:multiple sugar transport system substrate-binding protein
MDANNNKKLSRRDFLRSTAIAVGGVAASPLLKSSAMGQPAPARRPFAQGASGEITFWQHYGGDSRPKLTNELIAKYKEKQPDLTITYETTPIAEYDKKLLTSLAAGTGPDLFAIGDWNFALYNSKKWLAPADPKVFGVADTKALADLFLPASLIALIIEDKLYGIPNEYNVLHTYYRADQFKEVGLDPANPPKSWADMGEYGAKLTTRDASGKMTRAGFQWPYRPPMNNEWVLKQFHPLIYQLGGDILAEDGKSCTLNTPEGERAAQTVLDFVVKYKCSEPGYTLTDKNPEFWQGRMSMDLQGPWGAGLGKATNPELYAKYPDGWAITNYPHYVDAKRKMSPLWRWAMVVNGASKMADAAWGYLDFQSQFQLRWLQDVGDIPSRKGWENDPSLKDLPWLPIQLKDFDYGVPVPQTVKYFEIEEQLGQAIERIIAAKGGIKESLQQATDQINQILKS